VEEFGLVEADFQQYYHLNLETIHLKMVTKGRGFLRYARLFANLPSNSRTMIKLAPAGNWSWSDETASRILSELSELKALTYNAKRKKGQKPMKPDQQFQPDYIKEAKDEYIKWQKEQSNDRDEIDTMKAFWQARNPDITIV
jgi:hypothetical protein